MAEALYTDGFMGPEADDPDADIGWKTASIPFANPVLGSVTLDHTQKNFQQADLIKDGRLRLFRDSARVPGSKCSNGKPADGQLPPTFAELLNESTGVEALWKVIPAPEKLVDVKPDELSKKIYIAWAGVLPDDLTKLLVFWSVPVRLVNPAAVLRKLGVPSETDESDSADTPPATAINAINVSMHGRLMVVNFDRPISIDNETQQLFEVPAGSVAHLTRTAEASSYPFMDPDKTATYLDGQDFSYDTLLKTQSAKYNVSKPSTTVDTDTGAVTGTPIEVSEYSERLIAIANEDQRVNVRCVYPATYEAITLNGGAVPLWALSYAIYGSAHPGLPLPLTRFFTVPTNWPQTFSATVIGIGGGGPGFIRVTGRVSDEVDIPIDYKTPPAPTPVVGQLVSGTLRPADTSLYSATGGCVCSGIWDEYTPFTGSGVSIVARGIVAGGKASETIQPLRRTLTGDPPLEDPEKVYDHTLLGLPLNYQHGAPLPSIIESNDFKKGLGYARLTRGSPSIGSASWDADLDLTPALIELEPVYQGAVYDAATRQLSVVFNKPLPASTPDSSKFSYSPSLGSTAAAIAVVNNTVRITFSGDPYTPISLGIAADAFVTHTPREDTAGTVLGSVNNSPLNVPIITTAPFNFGVAHTVRAVFVRSTNLAQIEVYASGPMTIVGTTLGNWAVNNVVGMTVASVASAGADGKIILSLSRAFTQTDLNAGPTLTCSNSSTAFGAVQTNVQSVAMAAFSNIPIVAKIAAFCYVPIINRFTEVPYPVGCQVEIFPTPVPLKDQRTPPNIRNFYDTRIVEVAAYRTLRVGRGNIVREATGNWPRIYGLLAPLLGFLPTTTPYAVPTAGDFSTKTDQFVRGLATAKDYATGEIVWLAIALQVGTVQYGQHGAFTVPEGAWVASTRAVRAGPGLVYIVDRTL